ncbi:MAG TPA: aminotransferase class I/II-fold pyridoxal phosphate-dependent enzyme [Blastocatellia bacterium]|nr:aminotransferase class I/II-fold pyridoxal phosphate-dependent enzyme [Blastocatellia bacterium]HMX28275.1 aminotransferase class I/II-fold pyridoxal phosphate-dependent enzyme [Blastocatellia bacterium]HMY76674.1 aminotransferase class I/II-fold pyridoxal phosphate-dependent enzyme [Blastocatellia bacterium]HMZ19267.1 aminotransferase class I/II-fold pyridoxal phosphate-dependent enzyme [Blastocatellia bacterium]HNG34152.1 aminotransferase class I/II-fold pyridoxal phosphate-dependent enzym
MDYRFPLIEKLPPYVFAVVSQLKMEARRRGEDIIDMGMGNPDLATPDPIVDKLIEAARNPRNHRYSASKGIPNLRLEISKWYARRYNVDIDPETEAIVTIGAKEGFSHLVLALVEPGDKVIVPDPSYPIHSFAATIAGCQLIKLPIDNSPEEMMDALRRLEYPRSEQPKLLVLSFPHNPTTTCVELDFFEEAVALARERGYLIIHDLAYADQTFDGYKAPSILQVPGAKDVAVEMFSMSKSYSMPGWRMGFCVGNKQAIGALTRLKSYLDYGIFQPVQIAGVIALRDCDHIVPEIVEVYRKRRDVLIKGLNTAGWKVPSPKGTMFVWAKIPEFFAKDGSLEFAKQMITRAGVAVSPGIGFGERGEGYVRFALVENEQRIAQAVRGIKSFLND